MWSDKDDPDPGRSSLLTLTRAGAQSPGVTGAAPAPQIHPWAGSWDEGEGGIPIPILASVVGHDGERAELAELGVVLPLPLLVAQPGPVDLRRQVPKNLVHLRVVDNLLEKGDLGREGNGGVSSPPHPPPPLGCPRQPLAAASVSKIVPSHVAMPPPWIITTQHTLITRCPSPLASHLGAARAGAELFVLQSPGCSGMLCTETRPGHRGVPGPTFLLLQKQGGGHEGKGHQGFKSSAWGVGGTGRCWRCQQR